jgi:hypothetical protein
MFTELIKYIYILLLKLYGSRVKIELISNYLSKKMS